MSDPQLLKPCPVCGGSARVHATIEKRQQGELSDKVLTRPEQDGDGNMPCRNCTYLPHSRDYPGQVLTEFGQELERLVRLWMEDRLEEHPE